jgi:hypothetical protein
LQQDEILMVLEDRILGVRLTAGGQGESYLTARRRFPVTFHPLIEAHKIYTRHSRHMKYNNDYFDVGK